MQVQKVRAKHDLGWGTQTDKQVPDLTYDDVTIMPRGGEGLIHRYWDIEGEGCVV